MGCHNYLKKCFIGIVSRQRRINNAPSLKETDVSRVTHFDWHPCFSVFHGSVPERREAAAS
ncbi:hypothetical protein, partial [Methylacidimicrobium cyclopophantes]|uniref:hypothetical protein n=1 Tax=Methylacidimicrobium cyclopophantes TaxID=1041766 RepID=UPI001C499F60